MWLAESILSARMIQRRASWTREQVLRHQRDSLRALLQHAWSSSPFYRDYYSAHGLSERDLYEVSVRDLPILDKEVVMDGFDRISRDPLLRRDKLEQWIHSGAPNPYEKRYMVVHTSGSSGNTGIFVYDKIAWSRTRGLVMANSPMGRRINPFKRFRFAMCVATHGHFGAVTSVESLPRLLFDVRLCSVMDPIQSTIETLNRFQPEQLGGYATTLHALAQAALDGRLEISPTTVAPAGEPLTKDAVATIEQAWHVSPMEAYASSESMLLALRQPGSDRMTLMEDEHIFEILDETDAPVSPGETGRMVMTTLYNRTMPLIRYDMRDYVTRAERGDRERFDSILRVEGRVNEALPIRLENGSEDTIHPIVLSEFFVPGATKFQFVAEPGSQVRIRYMANEERDAAVREAFVRLLRLKRADPETRIRVERVAALPVDPRTGKYRLIVGSGNRP